METKELAELVRKAQRGDKQAQQEIYLDSSKAVYFLALKILRNKNDAEDITQDVFITVYEKLAGLKQPGAYYKWVNQITANACLMLIRKKKPIPIDEPDVLDALDFEDEGDAPTPEKLFDDEETRRLIMEIIDALPDSQRICVMYRYFNQLSIEEIAEITGANEHTVKSRLALARNKIRDAILVKEEKEGIRLHVLVPIMPVLMRALEDFQMPEGLTAQMWEKIAEGAGIAAGTTAAASELAKAGAKEAVKQGVKAKVIGGAAGAVAVAVIAAVILWPKPEPPVPVVTPPPSSTPVIAQTPTPTPTPEPTPVDETVVFTNPIIENAARTALQLRPDDEITIDDLEQLEIIDISGSRNDGGVCSVRFSSLRYPAVGEVEETGVTSFALDDLTQFPNLLTIRLTDCSYLASYEPLAQITTVETIQIKRCATLTPGNPLPSFEQLTNLDLLEFENLDITSLPQFGVNESLRVLRVYRSENFNDISNIIALKGLHELSISGTALSDISLLAEMSSLKLISLTRNSISDITPLLELSDLITVSLNENPIADEALLEQIDAERVTFRE